MRFDLDPTHSLMISMLYLVGDVVELELLDQM